MKIYTEEDMETDLEWFEGLGVDTKEASNYINYLLNCKRDEE